MPRANRHYISGCVWHITHRCHKKEFLLKFSKDRKRWLQWLFEAKKRFGLCILNYNITSNHIHLLVMDTGSEVISKSIQLIAGRTAQEYNQRKKRKGAFWEDRYHATAIESGKHLLQCMAYIDLNMVRAGVANHPDEWPFSGYVEIQKPPKRYSLIDQKCLQKLCGIKDGDELRVTFKQLAEEFLHGDAINRDSQWSESIAVGSRLYIEETKEKLGVKGRTILKKDGMFLIRESQTSYKANYAIEKGPLRLKNTYYWQ